VEWFCGPAGAAPGFEATMLHAEEHLSVSTDERGDRAADADEAAAGSRDERDGNSERSTTRTVTTRAPGDDVVHPSAADREFGLRGYVLLAVMVLALVIAPIVVALRPPALSWEVRLVVFPLLPALLLGAVAVWATTRP